MKIAGALEIAGAIEIAGVDDHRQDLLEAAVGGEAPVEAGAPAGVAGDAILVDAQQQGVAAAVHPQLDPPLGLAGPLPLPPQLCTRTRPVAHPSAGPRLHPGPPVPPSPPHHPPHAPPL